MQGSAVSALAPRVFELATRSRRRCLARGASYLVVCFFCGNSQNIKSDNGQTERSFLFRLVCLSSKSDVSGPNCNRSRERLQNRVSRPSGGDISDTVRATGLADFRPVTTKSLPVRSEIV